MSRSNIDTSWGPPRFLSILIIVAALAAVPIGLADPHSTRDSAALAHSALERQQAQADATAGFPVAPHPDAPPRGPGE